MNTASSRYPFTASQWQELEHQALIYKYMISGIPIPLHLLKTIQASLEYSSTKHPHSIGWKIDPEAGRCKRTDGKKWRCSKEAYPDSKYCEKHMHRGRNRSTKPMESPSSSKSPNYAFANITHVSSNQDLFLLDSRKSCGTKEDMKTDYWQLDRNTKQRTFFEYDDRKEKVMHQFFDEWPATK